MGMGKLAVLVSLLSLTIHSAGKTKLQGFFVGAVMKESRGRANPAELNRILMERLDAAAAAPAQQQ